MTPDNASVLLPQTAVVVGHGSADGEQEWKFLEDLATDVMSCPDPRAALPLIRRSRPQLAVIRQDIPAAEGLTFVASVRASSPQTVVAVIADSPRVDDAVRFVKAGAKDYRSGPLDEAAAAGLLATVQAELSRLGQNQDRYFCEDCPPGVPFVGRSETARETLRTLRMVAESGCSPVLVLGETGTGKELAARVLHAWCCKDDDSFVAVNCAALTANLLESELFGHARGSFTGADREKTGLFELAGKGTIFLDEISEMAVDLQAKLLRVLQERTFRKVGGTKDIPCHATIVASSNRNLLEEVQRGRFRKDLYYRLAVFPVTLPPLRDPGRRQDMGLLAEYFLRNTQIRSRRKVQGISRQAMEKLLSHDWPGNVRELRNVIDRAIILEQGQQISAESIRSDVNGPGTYPGPFTTTTTAPRPLDTPAAAERRDFSLEAAEREFILRALKETGWQRTRAASLLGITRATLHAKLKRYDIQAPGAQQSRIKAAGAAATSRTVETPV